MTCIRIVLLSLIFLACLYPAAGESIQFHHLTVKDGLSQTSVLCVLQDSRGFIWFGTQDGLNRYDGYEFRIYKHDPADQNSLNDNFILFMAEDTSHVLWFGTMNQPGLLDRFDPATETFTHIPRDSVRLSGARFGESKPTYTDPAGVTWAPNKGGGLLRNDRIGGGSKIFRHDASDPASLADDKVYSIAGDHTGTIWIGTRKGLDRFDPRTGGFIHYNHSAKNPRSLSDDFIWPLLVDKSGVLWAGSYIGGLNRYDRETDDFTRFNHDEADPRSLSSDVLYSLCQDASGIIWVGTGDHGADYFNPELSNFSHYFHKPADKNSIVDNNILSMLVDHTGMVWIGTSNGLDKWDRPAGTFTLYKHQAADSRSIADDNVQCICEDRSGTLWFGTLSSGLDRYDRSTGSFTHYKNNPSDPASLSDNRVYALCEDRSGALWVGTYGGGLCRLDVKTGKFKRFVHADSIQGSLGGDGVWSLLEDRNGVVWAGLFGGGLDRYNPGTESFTHFTHSDSLPNSIADNLVITLCEDHSGVLWAGTNNGLSRFDPAQGTFRNFSVKDGLPNVVIVGIAEDDAGNLWISTNKGISRFDAKREHFRNYNYSDGLQGDEFNQAAFAKDARTGELFFGGSNGFSSFHPEKIRENAYIPPVVFSSFVRYNSDDAAGRPIPETGIETKSRITLSYKDNIANFRFAALSFLNAAGNRYAYKLEGYNDNWIQLGTERNATFTNLDAGTYVLRVRGSNSDQQWNQDGAAIKVVVTPPWWKTYWAYSLYGILIVGFLFSARQIELNRREQKAKIRESELRAKAVEAEKRVLQVENERQTKELEDARLLQLSMLPKEIPQVPGYEIAVFMKTATEVGGDYYDFRVAAGGLLNVAFGDATGHGMQAGTIVTLMKGLFISESSGPDIRSFFNHCSRAIKDLRLGRLYMAFTLAQFHGKNVSLSSAGMPPAYLYRKSGGAIEEILLKAVPLGSMKSYPYPVHETTMETGDTLLFLTDGLPEQKNRQEELFDYSRVQESFRELADQAPQQIINELIARGESWMNGIQQDDDITLLVVRKTEVSA
jgi:ligand-binding sensor domain-containing protein/serine phosphatase RsbU (regulator of sigma subunit)